MKLLNGHFTKKKVSHVKTSFIILSLPGPMCIVTVLVTEPECSRVMLEPEAGRGQSGARQGTQTLNTETETL